MNDKLYMNLDVRQILGIPERRILNITQKGVVIPREEATGAGSRRKYTYTNLIEFALVENLLSLGLGIQLIKKILTDLRKDGDIYDWVEDWDNYFTKVAKKYILWIKEQQKKDKYFGFVLFNDGAKNLIKTKDINPEDPKDVKLIKERLKPKKPAGILAYRFKEDGSTEMNINPWDEENTLGTLFFHEYAYQSRGLLIINLGKIKSEVDSKIKKLGA